VIREIFEKAAAGWGARRIAHDLNARGIVAPPPRRSGRPRAWAPSTIYAMLTRPLFRGEVTWNRTRKRNALGHQAPGCANRSGMGAARRRRLADHSRAALAGGPRAVSGLAGIIPAGHERPALGPSSERDRVQVPLDGVGPVRCVRWKPHRAQPSVWGSPRQRLARDLSRIGLKWTPVLLLEDPIAAPR
jgi:hypothetical protein